MAIDQNLKDSFVAALREANGGSNYNRTPQSYNSTTGGWDPTQFLRTAADATGDFTGRLVRNQATLQDASILTSRFIGQLGSAGDAAAKMLDGTTTYIAETIDHWRKFSDMGISMGGNAAGIVEAMAKSKLSADELHEITTNTGNDLLKFSGTMSGGLQRFAELSSQFTTPEMMSQLQRMGLNIKDANSALTLVVRGASAAQLNDVKSRQDLLESAKNLAFEMDMIAKLTGKSRKAQEEELRKAQDDARLRAAIMLEEQRNPEKGRSIRRLAYENTTMTELGGPAAEVYKQLIASGGITGGKGASAMQAMFPETMAAMRQVATLSRSNVEADRQRAEALNKQISQIMANEARRESTLNQVRIGNERYVELANSIYGANSAIMGRYQGGQGAAADIGAGTGEGSPGQKALKENTEAVVNGKQQSIQVTQMIMDLNTRLKELGSGVQLQVVEANKKFDADAGKIREKTPWLSGVSENGKPFFITESEKIAQKFWDASNNSELSKGITWLIEKATTKPQASTGGNDVRNTSTSVESHAIGTLGNFGQLFHQWGPTGKLVRVGENNKKEMIATEEQFAEIQHANIDTIISAVMAEMPSAAGIARTSALNMPQVSGIIRNIKSQISSAEPPAQTQSTEVTATPEVARDELVEGINHLNMLVSQLIKINNAVADNTGVAARNTKGISGKVYS